MTPSLPSKTPKWEATMNTSEQEKSTALPSGAGLEMFAPGGSTVPLASLPDPAILARMANDFFTALPLDPAAIAVPASAAQQTASHAPLASIQTSTLRPEEQAWVLPIP